MGQYSVICKDEVVRPIIFKKAKLPYITGKTYSLFLGDICIATIYYAYGSWNYMLVPSKFFRYIDMPRAYSHNRGFITRIAAAFFVIDLLQIHINQPKERQEQLYQHALFQTALALRPTIKDTHETIS